MDKIAFGVSLCLFLLSLAVSKKRLPSPAVLFYALWTFILFLSILNLYNIYKPSDEAYFLILLMLVFFYIGAITTVFPKFRLFHNRYNDNSDDSPKEPNYRLFYFLAAINLIFTFVDCTFIIKGLLNGTPMWQMRAWRMGTFGVADNPMLARRSFAEETFRSVFLVPFEALITPISAYIFFDPQQKNRRKPILFLSVLTLLASTFAGGGGRFGFLYFFGCFLLAFFCFSAKPLSLRFNAKKYRKYIVIVLLFGFIFVFTFTNVRTGTGNFIRQTYVYFALPPTLLSIWLPYLKSEQLTFGMLTFFGAHSYFFRGLEAMRLNFLVPEIYQKSFGYMLNAEIFRNTGYGVGNAFVTPVYYFFLDGGYPFVCFASFLFGSITARFFKHFTKNKNIMTFTHYALIMYGVFFTMIRIQTCIPAFWLSFVLVAILLRPNKATAAS